MTTIVICRRVAAGRFAANTCAAAIVERGRRLRRRGERRLRTRLAHFVQGNFDKGSRLLPVRSFFYA